jgi:hypothetical protein
LLVDADGHFRWRKDNRAQAALAHGKTKPALKEGADQGYAVGNNRTRLCSRCSLGERLNPLRAYRCKRPTQKAVMTEASA